MIRLGNVILPVGAMRIVGIGSWGEWDRLMLRLTFIGLGMRVGVGPPLFLSRILANLSSRRIAIGRTFTRD